VEQSSRLERYRQYVDQGLLDKIYRRAEALEGTTVLHLNTTAAGGGVAEILKGLTPLTDQLGIKHIRKVVQLDETSNQFTGRLVDMLQGNVPGDVPQEDQQRFLHVLGEELSSAEEYPADIYLVHDYQLVPMASLYSWLRPAIWFCHIDLAHPNINAIRYVNQFLADYELCLFNNNEASTLKSLPPERARVVTLGIDPFLRKHEPLTREEGMEIIRGCGVDPEQPIITQVARFDRWKNPWQAVDIYRLVKQRVPSVQLAIVGAMTASDDIKALDILHDVQHYAQDDRDVHLLYDPRQIQDPQVNAFQRFSSVILQRSTREGFGLTVSEAMWKYQPVVGTSATGLQMQIVHGFNGYIADDTETAANYVLHLLKNRDVWERLGMQAHKHVRLHFLIPSMLLEYLDALAIVRGVRPDEIRDAS
jgi:trehalose synthase